MPGGLYIYYNASENSDRLKRLRFAGLSPIVGEKPFGHILICRPGGCSPKGYVSVMNNLLLTNLQILRICRKLLPKMMLFDADE